MILLLINNIIINKKLTDAARLSNTNLAAPVGVIFYSFETLLLAFLPPISRSIESMGGFEERTLVRLVVRQT